MSKSSFIENALITSLKREGLIFDEQASLLGTPDIYFSTHKLAVFVNGCYWHGHECDPKYNNVTAQDRDLKVVEGLKAQGIQSLIIWECELHLNFNKQIDRIRSFVN